MPASSSPPAVRNPLLVSGVSEITLAVYFGWVIQGMTGGAHVGPFKHRSIVLQAHIDFIIMGAIQIAMSGTRFWKTIDRRILWPFIVACWTNAALFLPGAMAEKPRHAYGHPLYRRLMFLSFAVKTVCWTLFAAKAIREEVLDKKEGDE